MPPDKNKEPGHETPPLPSSGEGSDSALDVLKKKRDQSPPADNTLPLQSPTPPARK